VLFGAFFITMLYPIFMITNALRNEPQFNAFRIFIIFLIVFFYIVIAATLYYFVLGKDFIIALFHYNSSAPF
jgi:hypothetical protein